MASCQSNETNKNIPPTGTNNQLTIESETYNNVDLTAENGLAQDAVPQASSKPLQKYYVHNADDFLDAIGPDRVIFLYPGDYDLLATKFYKSAANSSKGVLGSSYYSLCENSVSGIQFSDVSNLEIVGLPQENKSMVDFITSDMSATVLNFRNCTNIKISNLNIGHTPSASCIGDVISIKKSNNIIIDNCILFGCGVNGLVCNNTQNVEVKNSKIIDCSFALMDLNKCNDFAFKNTEFSQERVEMRHSRCDYISFENCFLTGELDKKLNFPDIGSMVQYIYEHKNPIDNGDITFNWVKGYQAYGPKYAKIELNNDNLKKKNLKIQIAVDMGHFIINDNGVMVDVGKQYIGTNLDHIYWTKNDNDSESYGFCYFKIYSSSDNSLISSWKCKLLYSSQTNSCYTLHERGIPAVVSPMGNKYIYEDLLTMGNVSLSELIHKFGDSYTVRDGFMGKEYLYDTGLLLKAGSGERYDVFIGDEIIDHESIKKLTCDFLDNDGLETLVLYEMDYRYFLSVFNSDCSKLIKHFSLNYQSIDDWSTYDINNDSKKELYLYGSSDDGTIFRELLTAKNGEIKALYSTSNSRQYNKSIQAVLNDRKLNINVNAGDFKLSAESTMSKRVFYNMKDVKDKNDLIVFGNDWEMVNYKGKYMIKNSSTINMKIIEYYYGPPEENSEPNEVMLNDVAVVDFYLESCKDGFKLVDAKIKVKYDKDDPVDIEPMLLDEGCLVNGPALGMSMGVAYEALGGKLEDLKNDYDSSLEYNGVKLFEFCTEVVDIEVSTDKYKTKRGLKVGDSIKRVEELYGKPDKGFSGDESVEYKFCYGNKENPELNYYRTLTIYYKNDLVSKFVLSQIILD